MKSTKLKLYLIVENPEYIKPGLQKLNVKFKTEKGTLN